MKKLFALLLAIVMVFGLVACGGPAEEPAEEPAETPAETPAEEPAEAPEEEPAEAPEEETPAEAAVTLPDVSAVVGTDTQPLFPELVIKDFPERPEDPDALGEDDAGHYYEMEHAGWNGAKVDTLPESPKDGPEGKHVIVIVHGDHPWTTAYENGIKLACEAYGMTYECMSPNWDANVQNQLIDQAINQQPDAIVLIPVNAESATQQFRKIAQAGIPGFGSNLLCTTDAMNYMLGWTGPDDWGQMRELARTMADDLGGKGGVCYLTHNPGGSAYFARMYGPRTELSEYAPDIKTLDYQTPGFDAAKCKQVVSDWITKFGDELNAIFCADDSAQVIGTIDALKEAGRTDIKVYAAGNSKTGQDYVKSGDVQAINYQSAEGDAAAIIMTAAKWFAGEEIPAMGYMKPVMITADNVDGFYPCQW